MKPIPFAVESWRNYTAIRQQGQDARFSYTEIRNGTKYDIWLFDPPPARVWRITPTGVGAWHTE